MAENRKNMRREGSSGSRESRRPNDGRVMNNRQSTYDEPARTHRSGRSAGQTHGRSHRGRRAKKGFPVFWCLYVLFVAAMIVFWIAVVGKVKENLLIYEDSQPDKKVDGILAQLKESGLEEYLQVTGEISRFETKENYSREFAGRVENKILFAAKAKGAQDTAAPRYELYADGDLIGYFTLREASSKSLMVFLTLSEWELGTVEVIPATAQEAVKITVPDSYQVKINGISVDERELTDGNEMPEEFVYAAAYVEVPRLVTYETKGLLEQPNIEILDQNGVKMEAAMQRNGRETIVELGRFAETEMPGDLAAKVLEQAERYTNFFSVDLAGCRNSVSPIRDMFPEDSYYLELADTYRREDMWMYSSHNAPVFRNEEVSHYIRYSDDLFSCEVYFDKDMLLHKTGKVKVDTTHFKLFYGNLNGEWKILDIKTLLDDAGKE